MDVVAKKSKEDEGDETSEAEETESDEPEREVDSYFTEEMTQWLDVRLEVWLPVFAKWQIYFIAKSIRSAQEPADPSLEHGYWEDDMMDIKPIPAREQMTFKVNLLRANPRNPAVLKGLKHHVVPEFKRVFIDKVPEQLRKGNFPLNKVGRYKDGPHGFYEDFMEAVESSFAHKHVYRWLLDSTGSINRDLVVNLAKRTVELLGPKAWTQLFDQPTIPRIEGLGLQRTGARYGTSFENPDHIHNQQRLKFCNNLMRTGSAYTRSKEIMRDLSNFAAGRLQRNFEQNNELFLPYLVFSVPGGNTMATKAQGGDVVRVHHNHVLSKLGLTRFSSTEQSKAFMLHHWDDIGWDLWHECYCLLFAAWDEAKAYSASLLRQEGGRVVTTWRKEGRFNRLHHHPINQEAIIKIECAREQGMPPIEHEEDAQTVTSEFSLHCQRAIGEKVSYEEQISEFSDPEPVRTN